MLEYYGKVLPDQWLEWGNGKNIGWELLPQPLFIPNPMVRYKLIDGLWVDPTEENA